MRSVKVLHCADVHIGACESFLGSKAKQRQAETLRTFQRIVDTAKEENVQIFLISGDLFDSLDIEYSYIREVLSSISSAPEIKFFYSAGNHDPYTPDAPFRKAVTPQNLYIFDTKDSVFSFEDIGVRVYGRSFKEVYDKGEEIFSLVPPEDDFINIMCIHGELTSDRNSQYCPITQQFIKESGMDYIALGHIHKCTDIGKLGKTNFAYCGCPEGQGFDESGKKGVLLGNISKSGAQLSFVPQSLRMHIVESVDITGAVSAAEVSEKITAQLSDGYGEKYADNLYKIVLSGTSPESGINCDEIAARLSETLYFVKLKDKTAPETDLSVLSKEPSLKGIFVKKMLEKIESADESQKAVMTDALYLGLKAFSTEVTYGED